MAKYTENIRLAQPEGSDYYDIEVFNHNSELIDKKIGEMDNSLSTIKEGATREKTGIVQFGTEEGKALEGMMLARLAGCVGYGGDIQTAGVKDINYLYYDRNTRKMYKCLNQNSDVSANVANFIPLDNNSLLDRLENLFKIIEVDTSNFTIVIKYRNDTKYEFKNNWEQIINCESMSAQIITAGRILIQILTYNFNRKIDKTRLTFPKTFSATPFVTITDNDNAVTSRNLDYAIGWNTASYVDISNVVGGFTVLLIGVI